MPLGDFIPKPPAEKYHYDELWRNVSPDDSDISGRKAVEFLKMSCVDSGILKQIWGLSTPTSSMNQMVRSDSTDNIPFRNDGIRHYARRCMCQSVCILLWSQALQWQDLSLLLLLSLSSYWLIVAVGVIIIANVIDFIIIIIFPSIIAAIQLSPPVHHYGAKRRNPHLKR